MTKLSRKQVMTLLKYDKKYSQDENMTPTKEAALYDFVLGHVSARGAASITGLSQQGVYTAAIRQLRVWVGSGELNPSKLKTRIEQDLKDEKKELTNEPRTGN